MPPEERRNEHWELGIVLGLLGSIAINTGNNIQSLGLKSLEKNIKSRKVYSERHSSTQFVAKDDQRALPINIDGGNSTGTTTQGGDIELRPLSSVTWIIGTTIFVTGSILNFASYAFAAQSMLASLESIQFVTNLLFGKFMLGANVTKTMLAGTILTVTGTLLAVQFSSKATIELDIKEMQQLYANPAYIIYLVLMVGLLVPLHFLYHHYEKRKSNGIPLRYTEIVIPLTYSNSSAVFGTQSVVQAKVLAELLAVHSSGNGNIFHSWFSYFTMTYWLITVGVWLTRLNRALSIFNPMVIIPLLQCSFIFFAILSGGIFFKEFNSFTMVQWLGFWSGICVMFTGLTLLTPNTKNVNEEVLSQEVAIMILSQSCGSEVLENTVTTSKQTTPLTHNQGSLKRTKDDYLVQHSMIDATKRNDTHESLQSLESQKRAHRSSWIIPESGYEVREQQSLRRRSPRKSLTHAAVTAMKDVVLESAKGVVSCSNMLLTPHNGTGALTNAMVASTLEKENTEKRMKKLKILQLLLMRRCSSTVDIMTREILELVHDLGLESNVLKNGINPAATELDVIRSQLGSPRKFRETILQKASDLEKALEKDGDSDKARKILNVEFNYEVA